MKLLLTLMYFALAVLYASLGHMVISVIYLVGGTIWGLSAVTGER